MSICDSEENRKKLAWLVPSYILLAWFFCVLFQPLGIHSPTNAAIRSRFHSDEKNYQVHYLLDNSDVALLEQDSDFDVPKVCEANGSVITLGPGAKSGVIIRLSQHAYPYRSFNCSVQIRAGQGLDGLTAVVEEMDLREHEDDRRQPGGHWGSSFCVDYVEASTDKSKVKNKLCGRWHVDPSDRLNSHGPRQTLVGYCYDDRSGHSCESKTITINTVIGGSNTLPGFPLSLKGRQGFSIIITGYRHLRNDSDAEECNQDEFTCPIHDFSLHDQRPHCIWKALRCDSHQNCGFTFNQDETNCLFRDGISSVNPWSISTMTLLIVIYLTIVLILVLVTMILLRWHKAIRTPLDLVVANQRGLTSAFSPSSDIQGAHMTTNELPDGSMTTEARTGTVSIVVSYRRTLAKAKTNECPPSYDSLFRDECPPNYNSVMAEQDAAQGASALASTSTSGTTAVTVEIEQPASEETQPLTFRTDHCDCDCDHHLT